MNPFLECSGVIPFVYSTLQDRTDVLIQITKTSNGVDFFAIKCKAENVYWLLGVDLCLTTECCGCCCLLAFLCALNVHVKLLFSPGRGENNYKFL